MLTLLIVIGIIMVVGGLIISEKTYQKGLGEWMGAIGFIVAIISFIAIIICGICLSNRMIINDKIELYQNENKKIETQVNTTIEGYKKYEQGTLKDFKNNSPIVLVTLYPELKTDELVKNQISLYVSNNQKIKELKEEKLSCKPLAWWVYFGN